MRTASIKWVIPVALAATLLAGCGSNDDGTPATPAAAATSAAPAGNGIADKTPTEILTEAKAALKEANSYRLKGELEMGTEKGSLDIAVSGSDIKGKISMGAQGSVELLSVGGQQYIRPDEKFWSMIGDGDGKTMAQLLGDRWGKVSDKDQNLEGLFSITDMEGLLDPDGTVTKGEAKQINGVEAISLIEAGAEGGTLWIATTGKPYPVQMDGPADSPGQIVFSGFGEDQGIKVPPAANVVDFDKLAGKK